MDKNRRLSFCRGDWIAVGIVVFLIVLSAILFFPRTKRAGGSAEVYMDGKKIHTLSLSEDAEVTVTGEYTNVISVRDGKICVLKSDCPGGDCVHTGAIFNEGMIIVCLPNRMEIRITDESGVDFAVR